MKKTALLFIFMFSLLFHRYTAAQEYYPGDDTTKTIYIPVVFHVVYNNNKIRNYINREYLSTIINLVNKNFNEVNKSNIYRPYRERVASCNIKFYIPEIAYDNYGEVKSPISYHYSNKIYKILEKPISLIDYLEPYFYDNELKSKGYINSRKYLNIWISPLKDNKGNVGYSTFPQETNPKNDGIVISDIIFYNKAKQDPRVNNQFTANILTHEIGHWLGLFHIWGKLNSTPITNACMNIYEYDDEVKDTPKQSKNNPMDFEGNKFDEMLPTCENPNIKSNYQNFMDYTYHKYSMFTHGQKKRMRWHIYAYRPELLNNTGPEDVVSGNNESNGGGDDYGHNNDNVPTTGYNDNYPINYDKKYMYFNIPPEYDYDVHLTGFGVQDFNNVVLPNNTKNYLPYGRYLVEIYDKQKRAVAELIFDFYHGTDNIVFETSQDGCIFWRYESENQIRKFNYLPDYFHCQNVDPYFTSRQRTNNQSASQPVAENAGQTHNDELHAQSGEVTGSHEANRPEGSSVRPFFEEKKPLRSSDFRHNNNNTDTRIRRESIRYSATDRFGNSRNQTTRRTPIRPAGRRLNPLRNTTPSTRRQTQTRSGNVGTPVRTRRLPVRSTTRPSRSVQRIRTTPARNLRRSPLSGNHSARRSPVYRSGRTTRTRSVRHQPIRTYPARQRSTYPSRTRTRSSRSISPVRRNTSRTLHSTRRSRSVRYSGTRSASSRNKAKKRKPVRRLGGLPVR